MVNGDNYALSGSESALERVKNNSKSNSSISGTSSYIENKTFIKYEDSRCGNMDILESACDQHASASVAVSDTVNIQSAGAKNVPHDVYSLIPDDATESYRALYSNSNSNGNSNGIMALYAKSNTSSSSSCPSTSYACHPNTPFLPLPLPRNNSPPTPANHAPSISTSAHPVTATPAPSFSPPYTKSSTAPSSSSSSSCPHYSTLSATHPLQSPDIPPSSLSALFPSICSDSLFSTQYQNHDHNHNQKEKEKEKEGEKEKGMTLLKRENPQLGQISTISSFASSFASSPSSPHSILSKESSSLEPQGDGPQSVFNVGCRERSISQLSTPSSFTSSPPSSFGVKTNPALPIGLSTSPNPNTRKSFFSYEMLNSALNMNKSRNVLQKCNDKSGMGDLKCSNSKNSNNNTNSNSDSNSNNCSSSSGSGGSGCSRTGGAPVAVNDVGQGQGSVPAKRPIALYPVPCDSVSTVLIHGFLSQGTEYSFLLPPQEQNEFIGKRVSQSINHPPTSTFTLLPLLLSPSDLILILLILVSLYLTLSPPERKFRFLHKSFY